MFEILRFAHLIFCISTVIYAASINVEEDNSEFVIKPAEVLDVDAFLERFGYLEGSFDNPRRVSHSDEARSQAIRDYQKFNGLRVTGILDEITLNKMKSPRCGVPDIIPKTRTGETPDADTPVDYYAPGARWDKNDILWKQASYSQKLSYSTQRSAMADALNHWSDVSSLNFRETSGEPDIEIKFGIREHGDGYGNAFDGRGGTLAHAFYPKNGDTHFDEDENWVYHQHTGTELETVATHEFGHALGLAHSNNPSALMAPYYRGYDPTLHQDDIEGIQSIYGPPHAKPSTPATTTTTTMSPTTVASNPGGSGICGIKFDAIILGPHDLTYVFREDKIYKLDNIGVVSGYPKLIASVFPGAPSHIGAAAHVGSKGHTYLFKGPRVWRFTNFELDEGYDGGQYINNFSENLRPRAAMVWMERVFLFGHSTFWEHNQYTDEFVLSGFPLPTSLYFRGVPSEPEAIVNWKDGNAYFFKGDKYYTMDMDYRSVRTAPKDKAPAWLGGTCGSTPK